MLNILTCLIMFFKTTEASPYSCEASAKTVKMVDKCPENEEGWQKAAARMNCSKYAHQCDNPDKFVYHCAVNPYINETLEVCAIQKTIVRGYCTYYSRLGKSIQLNYKRKCQTFSSNPCPDFYPSNEAFKYPGCYKLEMTSVLTTDSPNSGSSTSNISKCNMNLTLTNPSNERGNSDIAWKLGITIGTTAVFIVITVVVYIFLVRRKS
uniref:Uncharacterized protein LOC111101134 isoform X2 n=1 Tax=Crassostrea virginica TaxID=6565 RepID=A0A8B8AF76_CRAVI|nr:uncharacterized protein LOC111101134 isoform X2 [Crassostrea virginica]